MVKGRASRTEAMVCEYCKGQLHGLEEFGPLISTDRNKDDVNKDL